MCGKDTDLIWILIAWNAISLTAREYLSFVQQLHLFWEICLLELLVFAVGFLSKIQDDACKKFLAGYVCSPWRGFITFCDLEHWWCWLVLYTGLHSPSSCMPITMIYVMVLQHITLLSSEAATCTQSLLPWLCFGGPGNLEKLRYKSPS